MMRRLVGSSEMIMLFGLIVLVSVGRLNLWTLVVRPFMVLWVPLMAWP